MRVVFFAIFCFLSNSAVALVFNTISSQTPITVSRANQEEIPTLQAPKDTTVNKDKFSCLLNVLKNTLTEETENSQCKILKDTLESSIPFLNSLVDDEQMKKEVFIENQRNDNETEAEKALYQKIVMKIESALSNPNKNNTNNIELPTMIPIFKTRPTLPTKEKDQGKTPTPRQNPKSRVIPFVPEKIVQVNMNPIPYQPTFNIPCQRVADVLDIMPNNAVPKQVYNDKRKVDPIVKTTKPNLPNPTPALSVNCADSDDTVAMLFKPKAISLMQAYGNLLKKITITVLVPYHMSKLGEK